MQDGQARLSASRVSHSSDLMYALPITACGLYVLTDEAVRVAVGLRLRLSLCEAYSCTCGTAVTSISTRGTSCKRSTGRSIHHHHQINHAIWRALKLANIAAIKDPTDLLRGDGKQPDGLFPTQDVIVADILTNSCTPTTSAHAKRRKRQHCEREQSTPISSSRTFSFPSQSRLLDRSI